MQTIRVKILENEYLLKTNEEEAQVQKIAAYVSEILEEIRENALGLSENKVAILAAMHIASEYFQDMKDSAEFESNIKKRTENLIYNIDSMMVK